MRLSEAAGARAAGGGWTRRPRARLHDRAREVPAKPGPRRRDFADTT
ncbi:hypothetical protein [Streptomyces virginiae]